MIDLQISAMMRVKDATRRTVVLSKRGFSGYRRSFPDGGHCIFPSLPAGLEMRIGFPDYSSRH